MKNLHGGGGSVVALSGKYIYFKGVEAAAEAETDNPELAKERADVVEKDRAAMANLVDSIMAHAEDKPKAPEAKNMTVADAETADPEAVEEAIAQIEKGPKTPSQPVLTVSTKVADLGDVLAETEGEIKARGYNLDNFAPDLFA